MRATRFSSMMFALLTGVSLLGVTAVPAAYATDPLASQPGAATGPQTVVAQCFWTMM